MSRFTRALGATFGVVLLGLIFALAPQKNASGAPGATNVVVTNTPLPVTGSVSVANTVPVSGSVSIANTVPISGTVNASLLNPPLLPLLPSDTITLAAFSGGQSCEGGPFEGFAFNYFVAKNSGILGNFTLPPGQVLVVTNFSWVAFGSPAVANQNRIASLDPVTTTGGSGADAQSIALADSTGKAGGSQNFPTGIVIQNPAFFCLDLQPVVSGEVVSGWINGFLAPDR
jgi:hypothetical protein